MPATLDSLSSLLTSAGLQFELDEQKNLLFTGFRTQLYENSRGENVASMALSLAEGGRILTVAARFCFVATNPAHYPAVYAACSSANSRFRIGRFTLDPADGEVALLVDHVIAGTPMSEDQLDTLLGFFPSVLDLVEPMFRSAIDRGQLSEPLDPATLAREFATFIKQQHRLQSDVDPEPALPVGLED
jgi:hypothetical protein